MHRPNINTNWPNIHTHHEQGKTRKQKSKRKLPWIEVLSQTTQFCLSSCSLICWDDTTQSQPSLFCPNNLNKFLNSQFPQNKEDSRHGDSNCSLVCGVPQLQYIIGEDKT